MAYITTPGFAGVDLTVVDTSKKHRLGVEVQGSDGNTYIYIQANESVDGSIDQYAACVFYDNGKADELTTGDVGGTLPGKVVVPQVSITHNYYGWAVSKGLSFSVLAAANCAADVKVYTTSTKGAVDDSASSTDLVEGLRLNAVNGGSTAAVNGTSAGYIEVNAQD